MEDSDRFTVVTLHVWRWIPTSGAYLAITLPPFGIFMREGLEGEAAKRVLGHELIHWEQYRRWGLLGFYWRYLWWAARYGYRDNPMEVEARERSGIQ